MQAFQVLALYLALAYHLFIKFLSAEPAFC